MFKNLGQKLGFGAQLRQRQDGGKKLDYAIGAVVGVISGVYIFGDPLQQAYEEKHQEEAAAASSSPSLPSPAAPAADSK
jgi:hypothetical protein